MGNRESFLDPIPDGYQIFEKRLEVVGIQHRKKAAQRFAKGHKQSLKFKPEPSNKYDPNAIRVIGVWKDSSGQKRTAHIGYLNKDLARVLTKSSYVQNVLPRLETIFQGEHNRSWIGVDFQLLGPKGELQKYESRWKALSQGTSRFKESGVAKKSARPQTPKADQDGEEMSTLGCIWYGGSLLFVLTFIVNSFVKLSFWGAIPLSLLAAFLWLRYVGGAD